MEPLKSTTQGIGIPSSYYGILWKIKNYGKIENLNMQIDAKRRHNFGDINLRSTGSRKKQLMPQRLCGQN